MLGFITEEMQLINHKAHKHGVVSEHPSMLPSRLKLPSIQRSEALKFILEIKEKVQKFMWEYILVTVFVENLWISMNHTAWFK